MAYEDAPGYEKRCVRIKRQSIPQHSLFREDTWPYNVNCDGWWGHDTLPKLNYEESPKLYAEYIMRIARKWVSPPYNVDGWRLIVAADLGYRDELRCIYGTTHLVLTGVEETQR